ncbi:MAG: hydroxymethylbilane synthase, partial [Chloroflexi bacterium]
MRIRLGTRGSRLALIQSGLVARRLRDAGHEVDLVPIVTEGDVRPPGMVPGEGVFVAAIANALLAGQVDIAVHSAKDVPLVEDPGLVIAAYPERADPR